MIVKLKYEDLKGYGVKCKRDNKTYAPSLRVVVDENNIEDAILKFANNKSIVGLEYSYTTKESIQKLNTLDTKNLNVFIIYNIDVLDTNVDMIMSKHNANIKVVINLPKTYCNMQEIYNYSNKYSNIRFEGGYFLRLNGCKLGAIGVDDYKKKVNESKLSLTTDGCACVFKAIDIDDFDEVEFLTKEEAIKVEKKEKSPKVIKKKSLSSLVSFSSGFDNF